MLVEYIETNILIIVLSAVFLGGIIKGAVGIGMSMFSVPIIAFFLPPTTAIIYLCFPVLSTNILQMQVHKGIGSMRFLPMFIALVIGLIIGCTLIVEINFSTISIIIALSIIFSSSFNFLGFSFKNVNPKFEKKFTIILGFFSGIIGGISNMYSPYILAYLVGLNLDKEFLIRTMAIMYFIGSIVIYPLWIYNGLGTINDLLMSFFLIMPAIFGQYFGTKIRRKIPNQLFTKIILSTLMLMGVSLLIKNL